VAGVLKKTTALVCLAVFETPQEHCFSSLYTKILGALELLPSNAAYRKYTEQITMKMTIVINFKYFWHIIFSKNH
uniref:Uncharacterized protein n=1 Tax=Monodelphis domestica TaxID=13616 RepID=A0A5F8GNP4_MONDO